MSDIKPRAVRLLRDAAAVIEDRLGGPISQKDLARRWGVSQATVSRWLTGVTLMPIDKAEELARDTGTPLREMMRNREEASFPGAQHGLEPRELGMLKRFARALDDINVNHKIGALASPLFQTALTQAAA